MSFEISSLCSETQIEQRKGGRATLIVIHYSLFTNKFNVLIKQKWSRFNVTTQIIKIYNKILYYLFLFFYKSNIISKKSADIIIAY